MRAGHLSDSHTNAQAVVENELTRGASGCPTKLQDDRMMARLGSSQGIQSADDVAMCRCAKLRGASAARKGRR